MYGFPPETHPPSVVAFAAALSLVWAFLLFWFAIRKSGLAASAWRFGRKYGVFASGAFLSALVGLSVFGGSKPGPQSPTPPPGMRLSHASGISAEDFARGFVLARAETNETHSFSPPPDAEVCERWRRAGSATGWIPVSPPDWAFPVGTNAASAFRAFAFGRVDPLVGGAVSTFDFRVVFC